MRVVEKEVIVILYNRAPRGYYRYIEPDKTRRLHNQTNANETRMSKRHVLATKWFSSRSLVTARGAASDALRTMPTARAAFQVVLEPREWSVSFRWLWCWLWWLRSCASGSCPDEMILGGTLRRLQLSSCDSIWAWTKLRTRTVVPCLCIVFIGLSAQEDREESGYSNEWQEY